MDAVEVKYWELTPQSEIEELGKTLYVYSGVVLAKRSKEENVEILLSINDGRDQNKFTQVWIKSSDANKELLQQFSMGHKVEILINPLDPTLSFIEQIPVQMLWSHTDEKSWLIPSNISPFSSSPISLNSTDYLIYEGEIVSLLYKSEEYETLSDTAMIEHIIQLDIKISGEGVKHYQDYRRVSYYKSLGAYMGDDFIKMVRDWNKNDSIKILVNNYYAGFWWIYNESRNEAIFVAQGQALSIDNNLWNRLGD